jgi:hypothetical protein
MCQRRHGNNGTDDERAKVLELLKRRPRRDVTASVQVRAVRFLQRTRNATDRMAGHTGTIGRREGGPRAESSA